MLKSFKNLADLHKAFPDENACIDHFRALRWPGADRITCPRCGVIGKHYKLADNTHKCRDCRRKFTVRNGTIFEDSKIELRKWFIAVFLMTSHKKGISSCQLARDIGVTQKTAWFMLHRIRNATMTREFNSPLSGTVEVDEAFVGPKPKFQHAAKRRQGRGLGNVKYNKIVFGMAQRAGDIRLVYVPDLKLKTTVPVIRANIAPNSTIHTDESSRYSWMQLSYLHQYVTHSLGEYCRDGVTTNRIENVFSHFKRTMIGTYHKADVTHLDRYLQMFAYRWNRRDMGDADRVNDLLRATKGRRISYKSLITKD